VPKLIRLLVALGMAAVGCVLASAQTRESSQSHESTLDRYLARAVEPPVEYRALRHLEASNAHFHASAWMDAWTDYDHEHGFRYDVIAESGNGYIRSHVLRAALEGERNMWVSQEPQKASITLDNYSFEDRLTITEGLAALGITPRRKDMLLIDGTIYVRADDGELRRVEGRLSKTPSFWTRSVEISRRYERIAGVRVPVSIESTAHLLIAGRSTFAMTYRYESINGHKVDTTF
jgi:hypothetical protein